MTEKVADARLGKIARQQHDLFRRVREGVLNPSLVSRQLQDIIEGRSIQDVVALFTPPERQVERVRAWNTAANWGFTEQDFAKLGEPPAWPEGRLVAIVLDIQLETSQRTFEEAWDIIEGVHPNSWRWDQIQADEEHLRLYPGCSHQRNLSWRVIDLGANRDRKPQDVRSEMKPELLPHSALLWAAALHPNWVQAMNGNDVPFVFLAGYQLTIPGYQPWAHVPRLNWARMSREVWLNALFAGLRSPSWGVPVLREA